MTEIEHLLTCLSEEAGELVQACGKARERVSQNGKGEGMSMEQTTVGEFVGFPKIARYSREVIVTEKIDGTNGCIWLGEAGEFKVGSRTQWITPEKDNHGFARWAYDHESELHELGPGRHFGEWWGSGIQRGYGLPKGEKRFSLFNVIRWCLHGKTPQLIPCGDPRIVKIQDVLPSCVGLVPVLWRGNFDSLDAGCIARNLALDGSSAFPGFMNPEGIVVFHIAGNVGFKKTIMKDAEPKGIQNETRRPRGHRDAGGEQDERKVEMSYCEQCAKLERENAELASKLTVIAKWLEQNQPDVFFRGIWDAINCAEALEKNKGGQGS